MTTSDQIVRRWRDKCTGIDDRPNYSSNNKIYAEGDRIFSYGPHFEMARALRERDGSMRAWLINGDRFSNTTSRHQAEVRSALGLGMGASYDQVTIPYTALEAASIDLASVQIVQSTSEWWEDKHQYWNEMPDEAEWRYQTVTADRGGWRNSKTGEFYARMKDWHERPPKQITCAACETEPKMDWKYTSDTERQIKWDAYNSARQDWEVHQRASHGVWEEVTHHVRNTGQKTLVSRRGWSEWDLLDNPDSPTGVTFERTWRRHWLGESLIRAQVNYQGRRKCTRCAGTGETTEHPVMIAGEGLGPLTRRADHFMPAYTDVEWVIERPRTVAPTTLSTRCQSCDGSRWVPQRRQRWAFFLSGFDSNETRPSYFFCELPAGSRPFTVAEAYEILKPGVVKLAEELGREVERQGDIFAVPMPDLTTAELKKQGRHIRRKVEVFERPAAWGGGTIRTMGWADGVDPSVLSTNHTVTEQVRVGRLTYARGIMRHEPQGRRPDHARIRLGDGKTWHLIVKNTVPIGA